MPNAYEILAQRGFIAQVSDEVEVRKLLASERVSAYVGFDPTASSLHVGNLVGVMGLMHLQRAGHRPIVIVGGGTGQVGDPSGKSEMRKLLERDALAHNLEKFRTSLSRFLDLDGEAGLLLNNAEWLLELRYVDFLREIGRHFSVNQMLAAEAYKQRLEKGLSFLEFNYQVLQAYDFLELYRRHGCRVQMGGNDQWGNICAGIELTRRMAGVEVFGVTFPLLTTAGGQKMGKSEKGAVWLDAELLKPYDFYQYWINVDDRDVARFLALFTFLPMEEIAELSRAEGAELRAAKQRLAFEVTTIVHGADQARGAQEAARGLFSGRGGDLSDVPTTEISAGELPIPAVELFHRSGLCASKSDVRRLIKAGGAYLNQERIGSHEDTVEQGDFEDGSLLIRAGKRKYHRIVLR